MYSPERSQKIKEGKNSGREGSLLKNLKPGFIPRKHPLIEKASILTFPRWYAVHLPVADDGYETKRVFMTSMKRDLQLRDSP